MKNILMILPLFIVFSAFSQTYDFTGETVGNMPANVSLGTNSEPETNDGTIVVSEYNSNNAMECTSIGSTNVGIFDMDLFTSDTDYSITWKETYTTARRSGFLLRANGACTNTNYLGMKNGYCFQVNSTDNNLRIYSYNGTAVTLLSSAGLTAPGVNTPRWYRATVDGTQLTFEYSDDGSTWNTHINITNTIFSSGSVQYTIGYGQGAGEMFIDDITKTSSASFTLSPTTLSVTEGSTGTFTIVLDSQPSSDVVIDVSSDKTSEATVSPGTCTFTSGNWDTPQTITVTGEHDAVACNSLATITASVNDALSDDNFDSAFDKYVDVTVINSDATTIVYDFEPPDVVGNPPLNITPAPGTTGQVVAGQALSVLGALIGEKTAYFNLDLVSVITTDYTVVWKENYTVAGRDGVIMRGTGSNSHNLGAMQGYLLQVSPSLGHARIYLSGPTSFDAPLISTNLAAPGVGVDRWYRATVEGSTITFEYSDDGTNFNIVHTYTDTTYSAPGGATQFGRGWGGPNPGLDVDDIGYYSDGTISQYVIINNIDDYQIFQRDGSNQADIPISGSYGGTPTAIEASFNGGAYVTIDASPSGGTYSGTLSAQAAGQGTLIVRFTNDTDVLYDIDNVGIGDIFIVAGESNASGRGWTLNNYSHASLKGVLVGNDDMWKELADAVDSKAGQIDPVSSDAAAAGSPWPLVASSIMAAENVPVAFVPTAMGETSILDWQPGVSHSDPTTLYGSMNRRITAAGGNVKAILFFQGERDAGLGTTQANYETRLNTFINTANSDFSGLQTMIGQIGQSGSAYPGKDTVRAGQINVSHTNANAILGPVTYDINLADEGGDNLHFRSDADMAAFAERWYKAIDKAFYSGTNGYGPIVDSPVLCYDGGLNKVIVCFSDDTSPAIDPTSTVATTSFELKNNGTAVSISSVDIVGNTVEITTASPLDTAQSLTLTYASLNTGVDAAIYDDDGLPAENFYDITIYLSATWDGSENTDWNTAGNWNINAVPTSCINVIIPGGVPNNPIVNEDPATPAVCRNLTLISGGTITVNEGKDLVVGQ